ncbi:MAG: L-serine ammonia-lyase, iron-sulfur-dependent, subunit alpha [Lachnospiraceae bacterium]|nr:L-serine ammonia-lyase, iron-sulfur-dependent, subunit alpha [Lachnospiraceae bacterium]
MSFAMLKDIVAEAQNMECPFWKVILDEDCKERSVSKEESFEMMRHMYRAMKEADASYDSKLRSASKMAGGDGEKLERYRKEKTPLFGEFLAEAVEKAVKMGESNACMRRIVAAPTAGSCGVIPAVLLTYEKQKHTAEEHIVEALYVAAGIGEVLAVSASISGAGGGCQAEIGSAAAMAAGALTYLEGGANEQIVKAAALALKNMLGLTCDPVAGLVEVPCIKRNASGAVNAVLAAHLTMAGIQSAIEPDEVVDSMRRIGAMIPACLRETSQEGLAATATARRIADELAAGER